MNKNIMFVSVDGSHPDVLNSLADISENLILFALKKHKQSLEDRFRYLGYKIPKNINIVYLDSYLSYFNIKSDLKIDFIVANCPLSGFFAYLYKSKINSRLLFLMCQDFVEYIQVSKFNIIKKCFMISLYKFILRKVCKDSQVFVLSNYLKKRAEFYGAKNVVIIPIYGVNMSLFKRKKSSIFKNKYRLKGLKIILVVSRLSSEKGLIYLIDALNLIKKEIKNVKLIFAGKGPLRKYLEFYVHSKGLSDDVLFLGHIPYSNLPDYYSSADVFVLPSLKEGLGLSIAEAMSCSVPVVASNTGGIPDLVLDGKTGLLVNPADSKRLAEAILTVLNDKRLASMMVHNAYKYIRQNYEKKKVMSRFISFIKNM